MEVKEEIQKEILSAVSQIGMGGATITEIEKKVNFERHTLSKYLSFLQAHGLLYHRLYGKSKVWFINNAPIKTVLNSLPEKKTFTEKVLSDIISTLPYGLIVIDKDFNILFMNPRMFDNYGKIEGEKIYSSVLGLENPLKIKAISDIIWGKSDSCRIELQDVKNNILVISGKKLVNPDNSLSIILIIADVTARRRAEEEVQKQKAVLEAERETLNQCAIVSESDLQGNIIYVNDKFCEISKYERKELLEKNHRILNSGYHPKEFFRNMWKTISNGKAWKGEIRNKAKDGSFYWVDSAIAPVLGKNGKPIKYISIRFDITRLKNADKKR